MGSWQTRTATAASGGEHLTSATRDAHIVFRFNGTSVRWVGPTGPAYGRAEVHLDGRLVGTVDQYAKSESQGQVVWSVSGLRDGEHAIVIRVLGERSAEASGSTVAFDAVESLRGNHGPEDGWPVGAIIAEENDARLAYSGFWVSATSTVFSGRAYRYATAAGASMTATVAGDEVTLFGSRGPSYGKARVYVDGFAQGVIDCYAEEYSHAVPLWQGTGLGEGDHTVKLVVLGQKNASSLSTTIVYDAVEGSGGRALTAFDDRSASVKRSSGWTAGASSVMLGGTYVYSRVAGATMTLKLIGSEVALVAPVGPSYGRVQVTIDGVSQGTVNLYASAYAYQQTVFTRTGLSDAEHTVTVKVLGTRDSRSSGTTVVLDGFRAVGEPVTTRGTIVATARAQLGKRYVWAGSGPSVFDCSGLTRYAYARVGVAIPHSSRIQFSMCSPQYTGWSRLVPGDLVFTDSPSYIHHVGLYVGWGLTINAPATGKYVEYRAAETYGCYGRLAARYW